MSNDVVATVQTFQETRKKEVVVSENMNISFVISTDKKIKRMGQRREGFFSLLLCEKEKEEENVRIKSRSVLCVVCKEKKTVGGVRWRERKSVR